MYISSRITRQLLVLMVGAVVLMVFMAASTPVYADSGWEARYWNNRDLAGDPVLVRHESAIDHDWGHDSPDPSINEDNFSARWTRTVNLAAGTYRFTATVDDGMRVWVNDNLIIDVWYDSQVHTVTADVHLASGDHHLRVEYYEAGGEAVAKLHFALATGAVGEWRGEYFNNPSLAGAPTYVRFDPAIDFTWTGSPAPGIGPDMFSVRWTRQVSLDPGRYRFTVTADDGVRLWVNNQLLIDRWHEQPATTYHAEIDLPGGEVPVRMEHFERGGQAVARLTWQRLSGPPPPAPTPPTITSWRGEYFNNVDLSGDPVLVRDDEFINFVWGTSSPAPNVVNSDFFSARWTRDLNLPAGRYLFTVAVDDGVRLWVNNQLLIDEWRVQRVTTYRADITLPGGPVPVRLEYYEYTGLAEIQLSWSSLHGTTPITTTPEGDRMARMEGAWALNVRSGPGLDFEPFTHLMAGQVVEMVGRDRFTIWIEIRLPDGNTGWVSGRFLVSDTPLSSLPVTDQ
jgi:hypothetical protein